MRYTTNCNAARIASSSLSRSSLLIQRESGSPCASRHPLRSGCTETAHTHTHIDKYTHAHTRRREAGYVNAVNRIQRPPQGLRHCFESESFQNHRVLRIRPKTTSLRSFRLEATASRRPGYGRLRIEQRVSHTQYTVQPRNPLRDINGRTTESTVIIVYGIYCYGSYSCALAAQPETLAVRGSFS